MLNNIESYIRKNDFQGYDPYDILNSPIPFRWFGTLVQAVVIQFSKLNPINLRPLMGIKKGINPKALGLLLSGYAALYRQNRKEEYRVEMDRLIVLIKENISKGQCGASWGYNFDWATPKELKKKYTPSVVVTAFVVAGLMDYYELFGDDDVKTLIVSSADYVLKALPRYDLHGEVCFAYTAESKGRCYNASVLGAETLARVYSLTNNEELLHLAHSAVRGVVMSQKEDGRWNYSIDDVGVERKQVDFHQGFVLVSLYNFLKYTGIKDDLVENAIRKGLDFYIKNQFLPTGQSLWRIPKAYPVDIHNQAQGIITFSLMSEFSKEYLSFAGKIADWTMDNMYDNKRHYFYYRKFKFYTNKIPYMRWSQAWMFLALSIYNEKLKND